jgi:hypothetical protein
VTVQVRRQEQRAEGSSNPRSYLVEPAAAGASARSRMRLGVCQRSFALSMSKPGVVCSRRMHVDQEMRPE